MRKLILMAGTALMALPAFAWSVPASAETGAASGGIEEVVVTAQRRQESAQKAALAIQAISADDLVRYGVAKPEDLNRVATGVQIGIGGSVPQIYLRGVGNYSTNNYAEGAVALNIDGVYISRGWATRGAFFDLERVEVLKGPQGTLYGRNASGGAINLITARPSLDKFGGFVEGEVGNYALARGAAAINVPIGKDLAIRASGQVIHRDGYLKNGYDDDKSQAVRLQALYKPSADFSLLLTGGYQHLGGKGPGETPLPPIPGTDPWIGIASPQFNKIIAANLGPPGAILLPMGSDSFVRTEVYSIGGELSWNLGPATLTVIPSYRSGTNSLRFYVPSFQINTFEFDRQTSVETRLSNETDRIKWVAGVYYFNERQGNQDGKRLLLSNANFNGEAVPSFASDTTSYAGFGQVTYSIVPSFRVTGGLRYTYEHKTQNGFDISYNIGPSPGAFFDPTSPLPNAQFRTDRPFAGDLTFYNLSYKAGIEYDLAPRSLLYANYSTGFKSGGFTYATAPTFKPERLNAWELGIKNRFFDNRLQANIELFYWRYLNHQENHLGPVSPGGFTFITENAGVAKSYGVSVDFAYEPTKNDKFTLAAQYNPTKYSSFKYTYPSNVFPPPITGCALIGPAPHTVDCTGEPIVRAPLWTGNAGYEHNFDLGNGGTITAGVNAEFATGSYLSIDFLETERQQAYYTLNADLSYTAPDGKWSVSAWARNMTNSVVYNDGFMSPFVAGAGFLNPANYNPNGLSGGSIRPPQTYGIRARLNF